MHVHLFLFQELKPPCLALLYLTIPHHTAPDPAEPCHAKPVLTNPCLTTPRPTLHGLARPNLTQPGPCLAVHYHTRPDLAMPDLAILNPAVPFVPVPETKMHDRGLLSLC